MSEALWPYGVRRLKASRDRRQQDQLIAEAFLATVQAELVRDLAETGADGSSTVRQLHVSSSSSKPQSAFEFFDNLDGTTARLTLSPTRFAVGAKLSAGTQAAFVQLARAQCLTVRFEFVTSGADYLKCVVEL